MYSRKKDSFISLLENENISIIIPVIQRDYAQGRDDEKARRVRKRLIDDWISVLSGSKEPMDFNFIYGEETSVEGRTVFYPVDGQQRLTSLYLLHWYLAYKTGNQAQVKNWEFDYRTRNSASEFFTFLKSVGAIELFEALRNAVEELFKAWGYTKLFKEVESDGENLIKIQKEIQGEIQNQSWFKGKWEHDPTISACLTFLIYFSVRIRLLKNEHKNPHNPTSFWTRLSNTEKPAIFFTYLPEHNEPADIYAARTYTRMNARGKRLTDFENLKAMIDELESGQSESSKLDIDELESGQSESSKLDISGSFDRVYIDYFYNKYESKKALSEITKNINDEGLKWFRSVYYIYKCAFPSGEGSYDYSDIEVSYEDDIYQLSQGRRDDNNISEYLIMLKAVLELVCNTPQNIDDKAPELITPPKRKMIAFVLFAYKKWEKCVEESEQKKTNGTIIKAWNDFSLLLDDLNYVDWYESINDIKFTRIILNILDKYSNNKDYFISHDFKKENPFAYDDHSEGWNCFKDLKCRVLECKIMWHLIEHKAVSEEDIRKFQKQTHGRIGYLYYLCGYLHDSDAWEIDDWSEKKLPKEETAENVRRYMTLLSDIMGYLEKIAPYQGCYNDYSFDYYLKAIYAYISQCKIQNGQLQPHSSAKINECKNNKDYDRYNEHIWVKGYLRWEDYEYGGIKDQKKLQLSNLKKMLDYLSKDSYDDIKERIESCYKSLRNSLDSDYEECWLRFALQYPKGGEKLLDNCLKSDENTVYVLIKENDYKVNEYDAAIYTLLEDKDYLEDKGNYEIPLRYIGRNKFYRYGNRMNYNYANNNLVCDFLPEDAPFDHLKKTERSIKTLTRKVSMDLHYYINVTIEPHMGDSYLSVEEDKGNEDIIIRNYKKSGVSNGKIGINIREIRIDSETKSFLTERVKWWEDKFKKIDNNYNHNSGAYDVYEIWLDLRCGDYTFVYEDISKDVRDHIEFFPPNGGRRARVWVENYSIGENITERQIQF